MQCQPDDCYYACNEQGNYLYAQKLKMSEAKSVLRPLKNDQLNGRPNFGMLCNTIDLIRGKKQTYLSHGLFIWCLKKMGRGLVRLTSAAEDLKNRNGLCENMKM